MVRTDIFDKYRDRMSNLLYRLLIKDPAPTPLRSGVGICAHTFCSGICAHNFYSRDAHSENNIPAPVGSGLVPDRKGKGVGSVTSTPRDNVHTQSAENVIFEIRKNNLWGKYPTPGGCVKMEICITDIFNL